jgi:hypothetical protein
MTITSPDVELSFSERLPIVTCWLVTEDEFTREGLTLKVRRSFKAKEVLHVASEPMLIHGGPAYIGRNNGP